MIHFHLATIVYYYIYIYIFILDSYNSTPNSTLNSARSGKVHKIITNIYNDDSDNENDNDNNDYYYKTNSKPNSPLKATYPDSNRNSESGNSSRSISPIQQSDSEKETPTNHSNEIKRKPIQAYDSDNDSDNDEENNVKNNLYNQKSHKLLMMPKAPSLDEDEEEIIIPISNNNNSDSESSSDDNRSAVSSTRSSISNSDDEAVDNGDHIENYIINEDNNEITI